MPLANSKKGARAISKFQETAVKPALQQLLHNEQVAQRKIEALEAAEAARASLTFMGRLKWLVRGNQ
jgi:hypothetical protein